MPWRQLYIEFIRQLLSILQLSLQFDDFHRHLQPIAALIFSLSCCFERLVRLAVVFAALSLTGDHRRHSMLPSMGMTSEKAVKSATKIKVREICELHS